MTHFELFFSALSRLPLDYFKACGAKLDESLYTTINLPMADDVELSTLFNPILSQTKDNSSRQDLMKYVIEAISVWHKNLTDINHFHENRDMLEKSIKDFMSTLSRLKNTSCDESNRVSVPSISNNDETYLLLGLKPTSWSWHNRAHTGVVAFLDSIKPICESEEDISKMLDNHWSFYIEQAKPKEEKEENESVLKTALEKNKQSEETISKLTSENQELKLQIEKLSKEIAAQREETKPVDFTSETSTQTTPNGPANMQINPSRLGLFGASPLPSTLIGPKYDMGRWLGKNGFN